MAQAAIDNDILFKGASYNLLDEIIEALSIRKDQSCILGAARFVVPSKLKRARLQAGVEAALDALRRFMSQAEVLEPTDAELALAGDLELAAQRMGVNLDVGESQLAAIAVIRAMSTLSTGDKRAIRALEKLLITETRLTKLAGKVVCLEQIFLILVSFGKVAELRASICREPLVDRALSISFSCSSAAALQPESCNEGLRSYVGEMRRNAPTMLAPIS